MALNPTYPESIDEFQIKENQDGTIYDDSDKKTYYAEDHNYTNNCLKNVETILGENIQGEYDSLAERLDNMGGKFPLTILNDVSDAPTWAESAENGELASYVETIETPLITLPVGVSDSPSAQTYIAETTLYFDKNSETIYFYRVPGAKNILYENGQFTSDMSTYRSSINALFFRTDATINPNIGSRCDFLICEYETEEGDIAYSPIGQIPTDTYIESVSFDTSFVPDFTNFPVDAGAKYLFIACAGRPYDLLNNTGN